MRQLKHIEHKQDILPHELLQAGDDLAAKSKALQAALDAQASQPQTQKET